MAAGCRYLSSPDSADAEDKEELEELEELVEQPEEKLEWHQWGVGRRQGKWIHKCYHFCLTGYLLLCFDWALLPMMAPPFFFFIRNLQRWWCCLRRTGLLVANPPNPTYLSQPT